MLKQIGFGALFLLCAATAFASCSTEGTTDNYPKSNTFQAMTNAPAPAAEPGSKDNTKNVDTATFGAGCFWCTEAQFQQLEGVVRVESGYTGGEVPNPTYKQVCTGTTGHAEVTNVYYDPEKISFDELLAAFWQTHDPTQLNRQGADVGTQYRSAIFFHNDAQRKAAEDYKKKMNDENAFGKPVVTQVAPYQVFYKAEDYHQNYYNQNGDQPYCQMVVRPKLDKFKKVFAGKLKK